MNSDYLFVYGTLQKDMDNDMSKFLSKHAVLVAKGYFHGKLYKVSWFPGAIISSNALDKVYGSVFKLINSETVFKVLDDYEGIGENYPKPNLYKKDTVTAYLDNGLTLKTWVYIYNHRVTDLEQIISGDFLN
ncbi:gamma-glutamylcyclotransferase family protein [Thalassobellus suaedae]|uniref:Gamma-glutamylcyclotransferase family protein n=1 Tax=Thalassobellus suaedae TaxID=3074124 RepID=A0ABY9XXR3_9FLAO|nr:gamma-glutamylcyclotransferase family protein [Flavobacteriaceae bacterium HL-DH14]